MEIRKSTASDTTEIGNVHLKAFGEEKGPVIAKLALELLNDKTAFPLFSFVAVEDKKICGHILYTKVTITEMNESFCPDTCPACYSAGCSK